MIILLHTSKTMHSPGLGGLPYRRPQLFEKTKSLQVILKSLSVEKIGELMKVSPALAQKTHALIDSWNGVPKHQSLAMNSFIGDIYSGLRAEEFSKEERDYADQTLFILSGLYGILKPLDSIFPYRLEMGYKVIGPAFKNLYEFWGDEITACLPKEEMIVNLASEEFSRPITEFAEESRLVTPQFLTVNAKTGKPSFVAVHAKIARGAFARWMVMNRIEAVDRLSEFEDLGYQFDTTLSQPQMPTFVCEKFGGKGLSIKMKRKE